MNLTAQELLRVKLTEACLRLQLVDEAMRAGRALEAARHSAELTKVLLAISELEREG